MIQLYARYGLALRTVTDDTTGNIKPPPVFNIPRRIFLLSEQCDGGCQNKATNGNGPHVTNTFQTMWLYYRRQ